MADEAMKALVRKQFLDLGEAGKIIVDLMNGNKSSLWQSIANNSIPNNELLRGIAFHLSGEDFQKHARFPATTAAMIWLATCRLAGLLPTPPETFPSDPPPGIHAVPPGFIY